MSMNLTPEELEETEELEELEELEEVIEKDYTIETLGVRKTLRFRVRIGLGVLLLFLFLRNVDTYREFNPINSTAFTLISVFIFIFILVVMFVDSTHRPHELKKEFVYKRYKSLNSVYDYVSIVPYLMLAFTIINMFFFSFSPISGTSMEPNYSDNEAVLFSHRVSDFERFDVVIVYIEELSDPYLIKRVIGLPGELVTIDNSEIYINGNLISQDFIDTDKVETLCYDETDKSFCEWQLGDDEYFVLGDNRDGNGDDIPGGGYSLDSRRFDEVHIDEIYGKVIVKFKDYNILK